MHDAAADMPLPPYRHVPGRNERPDETFFDGVRASGEAAWLYGIRLFNAGYYWETHEVLEPVWLDARPNSRERHLVQAIIHLANGLLKETMGRPNARRRLAVLARERFAEAFSDGRHCLMGIRAADARTVADKLAAGDLAITLDLVNEL